jgi:hypothetical protein
MNMSESAVNMHIYPMTYRLVELRNRPPGIDFGVLKKIVLGTPGGMG